MKNIFFFLLLFAGLGNAAAQAPSWAWAHTKGGSSNEFGEGIAVDDSGNVYVAGRFEGPNLTFGSYTLTKTTSNAIFLVKYDSSGGVIWARTVVGDATASTVATDHSGNVIIGGSFYSTLSFGSSVTLNNNGGADSYVAKFTAGGSIIWARRAGGPDTDFCRSLSTDAAGNIYATGNMTSPTVMFDNITLTNNNSIGDIFIVKYDPAGTVLWAQNIGGQCTSYSSCIFADAAGNSYITGYYFTSSITFGTYTLSNASSIDGFVVKYNSAGNVMWAKRVGASADEYGYGICADSSGNVFMTGSSNSSFLTVGSTTLPGNGVEDMLLVKYDASGTEQWAKRIGGTGADRGRTVKADGWGNVFIAGDMRSASYSVGPYTFTNGGSADLLTAKFNAAGSVIWAKQSGGAGADFIPALALQEPFTIFYAGYLSQNSSNFDAIPLPNAGLSDVLAARLDFTCTTTYNTMNAVACSSYTSPSGAYTWTVPGTYNDTIVNMAGCDSVITVNLAIGNSQSTVNASACNSYTSPSGQYTWTATGTYTDTVTAVNGCDSVITVNLTIGNSQSTMSASACNSYTSPSGQYTWTATGTYTDTVTTVNGCDSVITVNLTVLSTQSAMNATACMVYNSPSGLYTWDASGIYTDTLSNATGCDSVITISLTVIHVDTTVTSNGPVLTANLPNGSYQWLSCSPWQWITGETGQSFTPASSGSYAVLVTDNGCTDTSACYSVVTVGIEDSPSANGPVVYPNPTSGQLTIDSDAGSSITMTVRDATGREVQREQFISTGRRTLYLDAPAGVYFVTIHTGGQEKVSLVIKQE